MRWVTGAVVALVALAQPSLAVEAGEASTATSIGELLTATAQEVAGSTGEWTALYRGERILVFAVETQGRMRIMAPVASVGDLARAELLVLLEANYGRALDAKFAVADGVVWTLFNRPMDGLGRDDFLDGLDQVVTLKKNYGTSYRSTDLTFGRPPGAGGEQRP